LSGQTDRFAKANAQVVGITCDPVPALAAWAKQLGGVSFPLASDFWPHGAVSRSYGVFNEERGRSERAIFVIDAAGIVRYIDVHQLRQVPDEEQVLEQLAKLPGA
jgi:peroxiredoxin (alkyl hydroperoxide reductase subunit C)